VLKSPQFQYYLAMARVVSSVTTSVVAHFHACPVGGQNGMLQGIATAITMTVLHIHGRSVNKGPVWTKESPFGPSRRFAAAQQFSRFRSEADIEPDLGTATASHS
jgi:hypothetical protein